METHTEPSNCNTFVWPLDTKQDHRTEGHRGQPFGYSQLGRSGLEAAVAGLPKR
jgi:hypothetical protein